MKQKKILTYVWFVLILLFVAYATVPEVLSGKVVDQSDISGYLGMAKETNDWNSAHPDDRTAWTNSMFGGMPTTMRTGNTKGDWTKALYDIMFVGPRPASYLFISLLGAFLLMLSLGITPILALGGAIAVSFCSYNMQIIQVGHNAKMVAMAFAPWVLAGMIWTYRCALEKEDKKWLPKTLLGAALFAMALNFQIKANHVQISYYLAIIILCYSLGLGIHTFRKKKQDFSKFMVSSALLLVLGCIGIATNANRLIPTYEYTKHTMRGGSELREDAGKGDSKGLDLEYATSWSYGWEELPNLMIPNYNGGSSSGSIKPEKSATAQLFKEAGQSNWRSVSKSLPLYWGPQPFTAGPMYMGAITVFLFILGLFLYNGKEKWWLLIPTLIGIFLGVGYHFMAFTEFWYYHVPFYNKFRTVSMSLIILQYTLPMLAFLTLDGILKKHYDSRKVLKASLLSLLICGGFCIFAMSGIGRTFSGASDSSMQEVIVDALAQDRAFLVKQDAKISLFLIVLSFACIYVVNKAKTSVKTKSYTTIALCLLVASDLMGIGSRYLNKSHFVEKKDFENQFVERPADKYILADEDPDYRVLDLSVNVFNDSYPSYFHKNIGGYSPVKLQRYQDLIDHHIQGEIRSVYSALSNAETIEDAQKALPYLPVLSALNNKYIIIDPEFPPVVNTNALGHCWFVDSAVSATSPKEEIELLSKVDLSKVAVISTDFAAFNNVRKGNKSDKISLVSYAPNKLVYEYEAATERTAVFSEIFYADGWSAEVDGEKIDLFRADWTLRAASLPKGKHQIVMCFNPISYSISSNISRASSAMLLLIIFIAVGIIVLPQILKKEA